jgi:hypothetical protein
MNKKENAAKKALEFIEEGRIIGKALARPQRNSYGCWARRPNPGSR